MARTGTSKFAEENVGLEAWAYFRANPKHEENFSQAMRNVDALGVSALQSSQLTAAVQSSMMCCHHAPGSRAMQSHHALVVLAFMTTAFMGLWGLGC